MRAYLFIIKKETQTGGADVTAPSGEVTTTFLALQTKTPELTKLLTNITKLTTNLFIVPNCFY